MQQANDLSGLGIPSNNTITNTNSSDKLSGENGINNNNLNSQNIVDGSNIKNDALPPLDSLNTQNNSLLNTNNSIDQVVVESNLAPQTPINTSSPTSNESILKMLSPDKVGVENSTSVVVNNEIPITNVISEQINTPNIDTAKQTEINILNENKNSNVSSPFGVNTIVEENKNDEKVASLNTLPPLAEIDNSAKVVKSNNVNASSIITFILWLLILISGGLSLTFGLYLAKIIDIPLLDQYFR